MDEKAYKNHHEQAKQAREIMDILSKLYPCMCASETIRWARFDGVITKEEARLLHMFY